MGLNHYMTLTHRQHAWRDKYLTNKWPTRDIRRFARFNSRREFLPIKPIWHRKPRARSTTPPENQP